MIFRRRTVANVCNFEGIGLHSATPVRIAVHPGQRGIAFRKGADRWEAKPENVTGVNRCTKLGDISTIEHLMSALAGLEITDAEIEVDGTEMPGLDGSSLPYVEGLRAAGFFDLGEYAVIEMFKRAFIQEGDAKLAVSDGTGHWKYSFETGDRWPHEQVYETTDPVSDYESEVAPARTIVFGDEIELAKAHGLGKGLDEDSVVVLDATGYRFPTRFGDEPVRHKMLDLIGDLYLSGMPIRALNVSAHRTGHKSNIEAAFKVRELLSASRKSGG